MALLLSPFATGFGPVFAPRSGVDPCTMDKYVCTMSDGKTCGKFMGTGDYGDAGFCYFKKGYAPNCDNDRRSCEASSGPDSNTCSYYNGRVSSGACPPQAQGGQVD